MKYVILVGDGMGDHPVAELGGKTPLEAAATPMMDELCGRGEFFLNHTVPEGYPPGSDVANMSLMGYSPARYYTGRAPLEAASMGIELSEDEIAFRCNLVTLERAGDGKVSMVDFCAGHISNEESHQLIADLEAHCASDMFHFYPGVSYRHLLVYRGEHPGFVTVPPHDYIEQEVTKHFAAYLTVPAWKNLLEQAEEVLAHHPVNRARVAAGKNPATLIWLWGEGRMPSAPTLTERFHITGSMISAVDLLKGLGVVGGLSVIDVPGATGYIDTNYEGKAQAALEALTTQDFVFVHVEAPDEAGHQGSLAAKLQAIEDFDSRIVAPIYRALEQRVEPFRMVVTMDHYTPLAVRTHTREPVPTLLFDSRRSEIGSGRAFNEREALEQEAQNHDAIQDGSTLMARLLERDEGRTA